MLHPAANAQLVLAAEAIFRGCSSLILAIELKFLSQFLASAERSTLPRRPAALQPPTSRKLAGGDQIQCCLCLRGSESCLLPEPGTMQSNRFRDGTWFLISHCDFHRSFFPVRRTRQSCFGGTSGTLPCGALCPGCTRFGGRRARIEDSLETQVSQCMHAPTDQSQSFISEPSNEEILMSQRSSSNPKDVVETVQAMSQLQQSTHVNNIVQLAAL